VPVGWVQYIDVFPPKDRAVTGFLRGHAHAL
jgi:hypothetical protein